MLQKKGLLQL